jgi:hypothetical protein
LTQAPVFDENHSSHDDNSIFDFVKDKVDKAYAVGSATVSNTE